MNYKRLGRSGLKVSELCLGTNNFGGQVDDENSTRIVRKAYDLGINTIDTANTYTDGKSEEIIGRAVEGFREEVIICSKVGFDLGQGPGKSGLSRKHILWQVRESLRRLNTDYIDVYYLHRFDPETPLEETLRTFDDLVRQGKVCYVGCSNFAASQISEAHEICERFGLEKFIVVQPPYNLLRREAEKELLPYCQNEGLGVLSYSPLAGGFLAGKYQKGSLPPAGTRGNYRPRWLERVGTERNFRVTEELMKAAREAGLPLAHLAVSWILRNRMITAPILGASKPEQVEENCRITELKVPDDIFSKVDAITGSQD